MLAKRETKLSDIHWLAGLLEGEGCFYIYKNKYPRLSLKMTDLDIVTRVSNLFGYASIYKLKQKDYYIELDYKQAYSLIISGPRAAGWMLTLFSQLGKRRRARITEILTTYFGGALRLPVK